MNWSDQQTSIFKADSEGLSLSINAKAGTGKTTTIAQTAKLRNLPGVYIVFNKRNAEEAKGKMPENVPPSTINSIGHRSCMKVSKVKLDANKMFTIAKRACGEDVLLGECLNLAKAAKIAGLVPRDAPGGVSLLPDSPEGWEELTARYDLADDEASIATARTILYESISQAKKGLIDFSDQIYMPACFSYPVSPHQRVLIDEAQDLNPLQHKLISRLKAKDGQLIIVGDPNQSMYGFNGAVEDSMARLEEQYNLTRLPLNISYRCPKAVIAEAQNYVPEIQSHPDAPEGQVQHWSKWGASQINSGEWAIICRNNAPLMQLAYRLLKENIPVAVLGRDIGKGLQRIINQVVPKHESFPIEPFMARLTNWFDNEVARHPRKEAILRDKVDSILALAQGCHSTSELSERIAKIFSRESAPIILSTIHKAKGMEWNNVIFLDSFRIPSPYAKQQWELDQEQNIAYVAVTRAKQNLVYANADHFI